MLRPEGAVKLRPAGIPARIHSFGGGFAFDHAAEQIAFGDDPNHAIPFNDRDAANTMVQQELRNRNNWLVGSDGDDRAGHEIAQGKIGSAVIKIVFPHIVGLRGGDTIDIAFGDDPGQATGAVQNRQATDTGFVHEPSRFRQSHRFGSTDRRLAHPVTYFIHTLPHMSNVDLPALAPVNAAFGGVDQLSVAIKEQANRMPDWTVNDRASSTGGILGWNFVWTPVRPALLD